MDDEEALAIANEIANAHGLTAEYLSEDRDRRTVGVQGDFRTHERPIVLVGPFHGNEILEKVSTEISSRTPINRVTFELARRKSE